MPNIEVETRLDSFPKRKVLMNFKLINHDDVDYYFNNFNLCSISGGDLEINNTQYSTLTPDGWIMCESISCPPVNMVRIPANGVFEKTVDIVDICSFLYGEPSGSEHYFRYTQRGGLQLFDIDGRWINGIAIPRKELPFILMDDEERGVEEVISEATGLNRTLSGAAAVESTAISHSGMMVDE